MSVLIIVGLVLIVGIAISGTIAVLVVRLVRQDRQSKRDLAESLGFQPLEQIPADLTERITVSHQYLGRGGYRLRNVFQRSLPEGNFYIYDLWAAGGESSSRIEQCAVAVVTPGLNLPRFAIYPRISTPGKPGSLKERLVVWAMSHFATEIAVDHAGFMERYLLVGEEDAAVRAAMTPDLLDYLSRTTNLTLHVYANLFSVSNTDLRTGRVKADVASVSAVYNHAIRIASYLA